MVVVWVGGDGAGGVDGRPVDFTVNHNEHEKRRSRRRRSGDPVRGKEVLMKEF